MGKTKRETPASSQLDGVRTYNATDSVSEITKSAREFSYKANCFTVRNKREPWHADFMGDMVVDGTKWCVFVYYRKGKHDAPYILVRLVRWEEEAA